VPGWVVQEDGANPSTCTRYANSARTRAPPREDAPWMQPSLLLGPITAQIRLCWPAVASFKAMQTAGNAIIIKISAG
jgi:hypothetical protein